VTVSKNTISHYDPELSVSLKAKDFRLSAIAAGRILH